MYEKTYPSKRFRKTMEFVNKHISKESTILDLGVINPLAKIMQEDGYKVTNTTGEDLDENQSALINTDYDVLTAFEIVEHLLNPYTILKSSKASKIVISVPLRLWFSTAYRSKTDMLDRHYHEFEAWQLDWLVQKAGYKIIDSDMWTHPIKKLGIRPILRWFTPRYYIIYAEKI